MSNDTRLIMFHKQSTSARLRFLKLAHGGVCGLAPLPTLSQMLEDEPDEIVARHPSAFVKEAALWLGLEAGALACEGEYRAWVDTPEGAVRVFLAGFTSIDPPFAAAESQGAEFVELPQARQLPQVELELLRKAYELLMGG